MHISVQALSQEELIAPNHSPQKQSDLIREKVIQVRTIQLTRQNCLNASLSARACEEVCVIGAPEQNFLAQSLVRLKLSARGYHRLLKVSRTIADIENSPQVSLHHLQQALSFKHHLQWTG